MARTTGTKPPGRSRKPPPQKEANASGYAISNSIDNGWKFYVRELYVSATPIKAATVEFGSFGIERGYASEITTFDYDGYLTGERIRIQAPAHLFFGFCDKP